MLTASAPIAPLGWTMFVELPVKEAYASLYQALQRLAIVLLGASIFAVLAGIFLARRMVGPIQALRAGAERIGGGDFAQRISIKTGDELEGLANQFNDMGARLQESYADLENKVEQRTAELSESLRAADRDIGSVEGHQLVSGRTAAGVPKDARECHPRLRRDIWHDESLGRREFQYRCGLQHSSLSSRAFRQRRRSSLIPAPRSEAVVRTHQVAQIHDMRDMPGLPCRRIPNVRRDGGDRRGPDAYRSYRCCKEDELIGAITIFARRCGRSPTSRSRLVENFTNQAVIAIENTRLLKELRERTDDLSTSLEDLRTAQDRLVQTEKLASLGQLTAGIAHEIKNPLNFVNNFSALSAELVDEMNDVLKPAALDDKTREEIDELTHMLKGNLEKVVQHGKRADSIVKNMLLHSREGSGEHRPADINAIVEESLNLAYHGARAEKSGFNITLKRDFDPAAGLIDLYPQEITRVFLNLISNGFYAATKRKEAGDDGFEPMLSATTKSLGNKVEIRIRDNGTGIPLEVKEKMFNPFFTTKPAGEGTGLGLSMSHDIVVKQHGGKIDVDTEPGAFTEFIITLPRTAAAQGHSGGTN